VAVAPKTPEAKPEPTPEEPKKVVKKKATFDRNFITVKGTKTYRYEVQDDGDLKILGEVTPTGEVVPTADAPGAGGLNTPAARRRTTTK